MQITDTSFEPQYDPIILTLFISTILGFCSAAIRIFTRVWWVKQPGTDDAFIALAALATVSYLVTAIQFMKYSLKLESNIEPDPSSVIDFHKGMYSTILTYTATHFAFKFSILFQSKRIFIEPLAQRVFLGLIIYLAIYGVICMLLTTITCWPVEKYWDSSISEGGCVQRKALYDAFSGINIFNDIAILISPMPFIKELNIPRRTKLGLTGLFACGGVVCVFAIIRAGYLYANVKSQFKGSTHVCVWSGLEINIAIICACVPALRHFLIVLFPKLNVMTTLRSTQRDRSRPTTRGSFKLGSIAEQGGRKHSQAGDDVERAISRIDNEVQRSLELKATDSSENDDNSQRDLVSSNSADWKRHSFVETDNPREKVRSS